MVNAATLKTILPELRQLTKERDAFLKQCKNELEPMVKKAIKISQTLDTVYPGIQEMIISAREISRSAETFLPPGEIPMPTEVPTAPSPKLE